MPRNDDRRTLNGILWVLCSGAVWRDRPERYGAIKSVNYGFNVWKRDSTFNRILTHLQLKLDEQGLVDFSTWMIDATNIRASKAAAGARKRGIITRKHRPSATHAADGRRS